MSKRRALILGGAGFIGMALTDRLIDEGMIVHAIDQKMPPFEMSRASVFTIMDLRNDYAIKQIAYGVLFDEVYQFACDMGGAGYIFTGDHDADVITNNVLINSHVARIFSKRGCGRLLYTSSSCVYSDHLGAKHSHDRIREPDTDFGPPSNAYGWEKLFSEQIYEAHRRNFGLNVCMTRFSTIYGPGSAYDNGREKAVAAICRKVLDAPNGGEVEVWGDGEQIRPLVYIDDLLDAITGLVRCKDFSGPMNVANAELTTCNEIARQAIARSNKRLTIKNVPGPIGKQVLDMSTDKAEQFIGWKAKTPFSVGLERTFDWIAQQKSARAT